MAMPSLRELQGKYNAVVAENERLYHDLRAEQAQHERYKQAYERVQEDVQKDQEILRQLYTHMKPGSEDRQETSSHTHDETASVGVHSNVQPSHVNTVAAGSGQDADRIRTLERDCGYLQAKVESLHVALQRYESSPTSHLSAAAPPSSPSPRRVPYEKAREMNEGDAAAWTSLEEERARRRRAEEQLTRCHTTLRSLREDAAQKEFYYYQQLAALQEQNTALLEDLDMWVTGEQQSLLAGAFAPHRGDENATSPAVTPPPSAALPSSQAAPPVATPCTAAAVKDGDAEMIQQMQQYLKDQETVLALKDRSIVQLEARVRDLESHQEQHAPSPSSSSVAFPLKEILLLRREAAAAKEAVEHFAMMHLSRGYGDAFSLASSLSGGAVDATALGDVHAVLHYVVTVLEMEKHAATATATHVDQRRELEGGLRAPPLTVVQPSESTVPYRSGETLTEAAQHLASLMRRHVQ